MTRRWAATAVAMVAVSWPTPSARGDDPAGNASAMASHANVVRGDELNEAQRKAVARGLAWLAQHQGEDGSFGGPSLGKHAGITALGAIAFMEAGNLPNRGPYGENVARALKFVLASCQNSGLIVSDQSQSPMYGHGFATLFLGEVYGMTGDDAVKEQLVKAVQLIELSQATSPGNDGGWRYQPFPNDADISVTICQVMALRAARDAGIYVPPAVMDRAIKYVQQCQNPDGGFSYMARMGGGGRSGFARSAAGIASLYYAGHFTGNDLDRGLKYLRQFVPARAGKGKAKGAAGGGEAMEEEGNYFYGNYYAMQAMFLAGGSYWAEWYPAVRDQMIARQTPDGSWNSEYNSGDYCTAMALIALQMPNRYLPVFNGKGPGD